MNPRWLKTLKEYVEALLVAVVLALIIRAFVVQAFKIPTGSMLETLQIGDQLLVSKFHYGIRLPFTDTVLVNVYEPVRGDIVVFEYPYNEKLDASRPNLKDVDFVKRIVGLPGDTVEIRAKQVFVNGEPVTGPYIQHTRDD
ncbi:MAG: signal peptidase I, partial [Humidesulfovibrio sp.]|nr:signal peptidase I [Humidesulfovibrio sp.]